MGPIRQRAEEMSPAPAAADDADAPYPYLSVLGMSLPMLANAYALTSLFPYVGWMVVDLGMTDDIDKAGFYAGYIAASFMLGRFFSSYFWGHMSDIYGRKPIIYVSCCSIAIFSLVFGLSQSFWMAVVSRFCLGLTNGIVAIAKTVASEISTNKKHEASAMGVIIGTWSIGFVIGPGLGGLLARPCESYASFCGDGPNVFRQFPYLLPNILPMAMVLMALPFIVKFLPETLSAEVRHANRGSRFTCFGRFGTSTARKSDSEEDDALAMVPLNGGRRSTALSSDRQSGKGEEEAGDVRDGDGKRLGISSRIPMLGNKAPAYTILDADDQEEEEEEEEEGNGSGDFDASDQDTGTSSLTVTTDDEESPSDREPVPAKYSSSYDDNDDDDVYAAGGRERDLEAGGGVTSDAAAEQNKRADSLKAPTLLELLKEQCAMRCILIYSVYSVTSIMFDELLPLWALSSVEKGGLAVETKDIGAFLAIGGACLAVFQATLYSRIANYLGSLTALRWGVLVSVPAYFIVPALSQTSWSMDTVWVVLGIVVVYIRCCNAVAFSCISILINNSVPKQHRGSLNGLSMTLGSAAKAIGPVLASVLFAWSLHNGLKAPLDYNFVHYLLAIFQVLTGYLAYKLIHPDSFVEPQR